MSSSDEFTPLTAATNGYQNGGKERKGSALEVAEGSRWSSNSQRYVYLAIVTGLVIGAIVAGVGIVRRSHQQARLHAPQEIVVDETPVAVVDTSKSATTAGAVIEEIVPSYRPVCEYYVISNNNQQQQKPPRILQTSMLEPSKPWSVKPCQLAQMPGGGPSRVVSLNAFAAPDAILQVNFTTATTESTDSETSPTANNDNATKINQNKPILGFGGAFTEAASLNFHRLQPAGQEAVLELLFGKTGLGYSIGRIPINSCDFSLQSYNFDDIDGDFELEQFDSTVQHDVDNGMVDFAQRAVKKFTEAWGDGTVVAAATIVDDNSSSNTTTPTEASSTTGEQFRLYSSPWSPPAWMKRRTWADPKHAVHSNFMNGSATPNCLRDGVGPHSKYAAAWALYFSKYIAAYQQQHQLSLWAVTVQNEPEFPAPWEACAYTAANMTDFVAYHLGPTLARDHPHVKILGFDHNKDHINHWTMTMLNGTDDTTPKSERVKSSSIAAQYLAGTAYHWYAGGAF